jgi:hypothetical protein
MGKTIKFFVLICFWAISVFAANDFPITHYPTCVINPTDEVSIRWADIGSDLNNYKVYFSRNPGGGNVDKYTDSISSFINMPDGDTQKGIRFVPSKNLNLLPGLNYVIIADKISSNKSEWKSSYEVKIILKHNSQNTN